MQLMCLLYILILHFNNRSITEREGNDTWKLRFLYFYYHHRKLYTITNCLTCCEINDNFVVAFLEFVLRYDKKILYYWDEVIISY